MATVPTRPRVLVALECLGEASLETAGSSLDRVVRATVYLADLDSYDAMNEANAEQLSPPYPARAAVEVAELPVDARVEIAFVASV